MGFQQSWRILLYLWWMGIEMNYIILMELTKCGLCNVFNYILQFCGGKLTDVDIFSIVLMWSLVFSTTIIFVVKMGIYDVSH